MSVGVDLIIESYSSMTAIEIRLTANPKDKLLKSLNKFAEISGKTPNKYVSYRGE